MWFHVPELWKKSPNGFHLLALWKNPRSDYFTTLLVLKIEQQKNLFVPPVLLLLLNFCSLFWVGALFSVVFATICYLVFKLAVFGDYIHVSRLASRFLNRSLPNLHPVLDWPKAKQPSDNIDCAYLGLSAYSQCRQKTCSLLSLKVPLHLSQPLYSGKLELDQHRIG